MRTERNLADVSSVVAATLLAGLVLTANAAVAHAQLAWESPHRRFRPPIRGLLSNRVSRSGAPLPSSPAPPTRSRPSTSRVTPS
jgi:hypothetical protein